LAPLLPAKHIQSAGPINFCANANMKLRLITLLCAVATFSASAITTTIANWTFEGASVSGSSTDKTYGIADSGVLTAGSSASGHHTSSASTWSSPVGNGSAKSFSVNTWGIGDYWQFQVSTVGYQDITLSWDQAGSGTGPKDFKLQYFDGISFVDVASYTVILSGFSNGSVNAAAAHNYDLTGISQLVNASTVIFRLTDSSTGNINGETVASGGTDRVDNFIVSAKNVYTPPTTTVPETLPFGFAAVTLLAVLGLGSRLCVPALTPEKIRRRIR